MSDGCTLPGTVAYEPDDALATLAVGGNEHAFAQLMSRHQASAYKLIRRHVTNTADASDVLQDTLLAAWRGLPHFQRDRPLAFWLNRIALNKCRDRKRRETVRRAVSVDYGGHDLPEIGDPAPAPPALIESEQELAELQRCLLRLPTNLRAPLLLTAIHGLSHVEAASILGSSPKAIEMRVYRARLRLSVLLTNDRT